MKWLKCLVIGSEDCGKTSLINTFMSGFFRGNISNDVIRGYQVDFIYNRREKTDHFDYEENLYNFKIYDFDINKPVEEQFINESELKQVDVIILCYLSTAESKLDLNAFKQEKENNWPNVPVLLVGCQSDLLKPYRKSTENLSFFNYDYSNVSGLSTLIPNEDLRKQVGAQKHMYCSAVENFNIKELFTEAFKLAINYRYIQEKGIQVNHETKLTSKQDKQLGNGNLLDQNSNKMSNNSFALTQPFISYEFQNKLENPLSSKLFKSLFSLFCFACLVLYLLAYHYCYQNNKPLCELFRELGFGMLDKSLQPINQTYAALFKQVINLKD